MVAKYISLSENFFAIATSIRFDQMIILIYMKLVFSFVVYVW